MAEIYIGSLAPNDTEEDVEKFFADLGASVSEVKVIRDPTTGRSRRFALALTQDVTGTIGLSNGKELNSRKVAVCLRS